MCDTCNDLRPAASEATISSNTRAPRALGLFHGQTSSRSGLTVLTDCYMTVQHHAVNICRETMSCRLHSETSLEMYGPPPPSQCVCFVFKDVIEKLFIKLFAGAFSTSIIFLRCLDCAEAVIKMIRLSSHIQS